MIIRSKAPLRLGLAGGGTDVSPYSDMFGGAVLNATLNLHAYTSIIPGEDGKIRVRTFNNERSYVFDSAKELPVNKEIPLICGVYNRIVKDYTKSALSFEMTLSVDSPPGSGLGSSSTLVVSLLGAFKEWLKLPLSDYDCARLAWEIERLDLEMEGGKQDQYAATFGGVNFIEFNSNNKVIVNPLRINSSYINELSHNMLLYYTGTSRLSASIIAEQVQNIKKDSNLHIEATHRLKEQAFKMKEALLKGEIDEMGRLLDYGWEHKKQMALSISNPEIDNIYKVAKNAGASGGKISGAGGGGYMVFYCPGVSKYRVVKALEKLSGRLEPFDFTAKGLTTWKSQKS